MYVIIIIIIYLDQATWPITYLPTQINNYSHAFQQIFNNGKGVPTEMWAFALPVWAYVLVGFCPMGFCPDTAYIVYYIG